MNALPSPTGAVIDCETQSVYEMNPLHHALRHSHLVASWHDQFMNWDPGVAPRLSAVAASLVVAATTVTV